MDVFIWYGGTFSPPVKEHIRIIKAILAKACDLHPKGNITLAVVPVHSDYPSSKVQRECILLEERLALCDALVNAARSEIKSDRISIILEDHDIKYNKFHSAYDSINKIAPRHSIVYLAVRERNMIEILQRLWDNSNELLKNCNFIVFIHDKNTTIRNTEAVRKILQTDYSRREYRPSKGSQDRDMTEQIIKKIHILPGEFTDGKCSEKAREMIISLSDLFHPIIFKKFLEIGSKRSTIYQSQICGKDIRKESHNTLKRSSSRRNKTRKSKNGH